MRLPKGSCPWWVSIVPTNRDRFRGCGFANEEGEPETVWFTTGAGRGSPDSREVNP